METVIFLLVRALDLYLGVILATIIVSWLVAFDVLNTRNRWVYKFCELLNKITNPVIIPVRRMLPPLGGLDFSPMAVIFGIYILRGILVSLL